MATVEMLFDAHAIIAESLLWEPGSGMLYWCDIKAPALYRLDSRTLKNERWSLPEDIGAFTLAGLECDAVVALRSGLFSLSFATGALERVATAPSVPVAGFPSDDVRVRWARSAHALHKLGIG